MLQQLFSSFQPFENPIGFGASDFIEFALAALLVSLALARPVVQPWFRRLAEKTGWCMLVMAILPVALRLALLRHHPIPLPDIYDEFGHLLVADTLRHFRLANPPHPMHRFFETFFVLQEPTYSSIYPLGQGFVLAIGRMLFGYAWAGVVLSVAAFCSLSYWMLRGWTTPGWALVGGLLTVFQFGALNQWMNGYWGGAVTAAAGCLVFGALPRLVESGSARDAALLGLGLAIHLLTRPYESIFLLISVDLFLLPAFPGIVRALPATVLVVLPALGIILLQNKQVTGNWTTLPYTLSQYQYGVPAALTFQPNPIPHRDLTPQQQLDYRMQLSFRGEGVETLGSYLTRLEYRIRFYRFFLLAPLYLPVVVFLFRLRAPLEVPVWSGLYRFFWILNTILIFALGVNFFPAFQFHYIAAIACLFVLMAVIGLARLSEWSGEAARLIVLLCVAHFLFWYGLHLFENQDFSLTMMQYETWDSINHRNPERRLLIQQQLAQLQGKQLVFVRYSPRHIFQDEWVYNEADINSARVVWARDLGPAENEQLRRYYPDRNVLLLEPDVRPPKLSPYSSEADGGPQ